jgi:hypothetical protein
MPCSLVDVIKEFNSLIFGVKELGACWLGLLFKFEDGDSTFI